MADWTPAQRRALSRMIAPRSRREEVEADVAHERGLTPEQKDRRLQSVMRAAHEIAKTRADRERLLEPEPPAADFPSIWRRLVEQGRRR